MTEMRKNYGRTLSGEVITDELIEKIVRKAEEGWDVEKILARREPDQKPEPGAHGRSAPPQRPRR